MARLWKRFQGEPFLVNPHLFIVNKGRKKKVMAKKSRKRRTPPRNAKGRFVKRAAAKVTRRRRSVKRSYAAPRRATARRRRSAPRRRSVIRAPRHSVILTNPRRRRRSYRRNPAILSKLGLSNPTLKVVGFTVGGMVGTPFVEGFAQTVIPASISSTKIGSYAVKIASALAVSFAVGKIFGREAGRSAFIGGASYIAVQAFREFVPGVLPASSGTGYYLGQAHQPLLGEYQPRGLGQTQIMQGVPDRLQVGSRF